MNIHLLCLLHIAGLIVCLYIVTIVVSSNTDHLRDGGVNSWDINVGCLNFLLTDVFMV